MSENNLLGKDCSGCDQYDECEETYYMLQAQEEHPIFWICPRAKINWKNKKE